ncbi:MAG TPA: hypothetical protein VFF45_00110 [Bacilli bacterium]|jgi:hypothetical protein|nr:hypothetical protein [Bacilli bacterium]
MTSISARLLIALAAVAAVAAGCSKEKPKPGEPVTFETFCDPKFDPTMHKGDNILKRVTIEGYLRPQKMFTLCSNICSLDLFPEPGGKGESISVSFFVGDDENQMAELPKQYSEKDIKIKAHDGRVVGIDQKVRVTGGRLGTKKDHGCQLYKTDLIEAL